MRSFTVAECPDLAEPTWELARDVLPLLIMIPRTLQGRGLSSAALTAKLERAREHGLGSPFAPVRPSWKERYPLVRLHWEPKGWMRHAV